MKIQHLVLFYVIVRFCLHCILNVEHTCTRVVAGSISFEQFVLSYSKVIVKDPLSYCDNCKYSDFQNKNKTTTISIILIESIQFYCREHFSSGPANLAKRVQVILTAQVQEHNNKTMIPKTCRSSIQNCQAPVNILFAIFFKIKVTKVVFIVLTSHA